MQPEVEAVVAGDEPMVDVAAQDTDAETDAQDTGAQDIGDEPEGFPGGPKDPSVLTEYTDHVAASVWSGQVFIILKLVNFYFFYLLVIGSRFLNKLCSFVLQFRNVLS